MSVKRPTRRNKHARQIIGAARYARFALIRVGGAALVAKMRPIEKNRDWLGRGLRSPPFLNFKLQPTARWLSQQRGGIGEGAWLRWNVSRGSSASLKNRNILEKIAHIPALLKTWFHGQLGCWCIANFVFACSTCFLYFHKQHLLHYCLSRNSHFYFIRQQHPRTCWTIVLLSLMFVFHLTLGSGIGLCLGLKSAMCWSCLLLLPWPRSLLLKSLSPHASIRLSVGLMVGCILYSRSDVLIDRLLMSSIILLLSICTLVGELLVLLLW